VFGRVVFSGSVAAQKMGRRKGSSAEEVFIHPASAPQHQNVATAIIFAVPLFTSWRRGKGRKPRIIRRCSISFGMSTDFPPCASVTSHLLNAYQLGDEDSIVEAETLLECVMLRHIIGIGVAE
jgi:hypothetical protein